jgi:CRP-like cAMP-binding protein
MLDKAPRHDVTEASNESSFYDQSPNSELVFALNTHAKTVHFIRNKILFRKGETAKHVYLLRSGQVTLTIPLSHTRSMEFRAEAGALLGLPAAFGDQPYSMSAVVSKDSEIAVIERQDFCRLITTNPALSMDVLRILAAETRAARIAITNVQMEPRGRVLATR